MKKSRKVNKKVILYSIIGLIFLGLSFFVNWMFIAGAALVVWLNQRELMKK